ncbi:hypothetical protein [Desulforhabdus sp. TSK]|uniref:hypothetical protein n=1 Tax=Desulforhabdus sp. TSK TaxID=2925014 RepID=UPI001FC85094|nr:hypothetical protein [Desulforhabdus sp. TSK]GKT09236.1 hypothetical protein DSTSK_25410 [Desulforhabdus sp. TSK]
MSTAVQNLINSFDRLPPGEKREAIVQILRRSRDLDFPPLSDDKLIESAESVFLMPDAREASSGD